VAQAGVLDPALVTSIRDSHRRRSKDNTQRIWNLVIFEQWREHWGFTLA
jgi:hypothetical protein